MRHAAPERVPTLQRTICGQIAQREIAAASISLTSWWLADQDHLDVILMVQV
jgi:hypothetical protein